MISVPRSAWLRFVCVVRRRPPISTRTDTRFPDTTLVRSHASSSTLLLILTGSLLAHTISLFCPSRSCLPCSGTVRSEEHTSELPSLMRISYAVLCLKNTKCTTSAFFNDHRHKQYDRDDKVTPTNITAQSYHTYQAIH